MTPGLVSIIVPYYNYCMFIGYCLSRITDQTYENWECIVVDDASTREEHGALLNMAQYVIGKRCRIITHKENLGYNAAKNTGIMASKGEFIRLIDADDLLTPNALHSGLVNMTPDVGMVHGRALRWHGEENPTTWNQKTYCHAQGRLWRRSVYDEIGLYYEPLRSMGDKEFIYRAGVHPDSPLPRRVKDRKIDDVVAWYRKHPKQMHKVRRADPERNKGIKKQFKRRIKQLAREGITMDNTRFPQTEEK